MTTVGRLCSTAALGGLVLTVTCGDPLVVTAVTLDIDGSVVVSPEEFKAFDVTATNHGDERVNWGGGSSSCQLGLTVLDANGQRHNIDFRVCSADLVERGLEPGESRKESFLWDGTIWVDEEMQILPSGQYRVFGVAGDRDLSESLTVRVLAPGPSFRASLRQPAPKPFPSYGFTHQQSPLGQPHLF